MAVGLGVLIGVVVGVSVGAGVAVGMAAGVGLTVGSAPAQAASSKTLNTGTMSQIVHARIGQIIGWVARKS